MYQIIIGGIDLQGLPPRESVTVTGGGREVSEGVTVEGRVIATRPPRPGARRVRVASSGTYAIPRAAADALQALSESGLAFTLQISGYELSGSFANCVFDGTVRLPPITGSWSGYDFTIYIPQEQT